MNGTESYPPKVHALLPEGDKWTSLRTQLIQHYNKHNVYDLKEA